MKCIGILPMAGIGSRIQPIAFSKELYPVAYRSQHFAISEFSIRAMLRAKVDEIKLVVRPEKMDIAQFYSKYNAPISIVFHHPSVPYSLPESSLYPIDMLHDEDICLFGLPDTIFSPNTGYTMIRRELEKGADLALGLFNVEDGSKYDSVAIGAHNSIKGVLVKQSPPLSDWIWGIWGANVKTLKKLRALILKQQPKGERLLGVGFNDLVKNSRIKTKAVRIGKDYFDIGSMDAIVRVNQVIDNFEF